MTRELERLEFVVDASEALPVHNINPLFRMNPSTAAWRETEDRQGVITSGGGDNEQILCMHVQTV